MPVPTWRTQAAPSFDAALRAAGEANKQQSLGMDRIATSLDEGSDVYEDIVKNEAYNTLAKVIPKDGQSKFAAREEAIEANPDSFNSSFLGTKAIDTMQQALIKVDEEKQKVNDKSEIMQELHHLGTLETPQEQKQYLNEMTDFRKYNNIKDNENILGPIADELLQKTKVTIDDAMIRKHGGNPLNERSLTPEILANIEKDIADQLKDNNRGASASALKAAGINVAATSKYKSMFDRMIKLEVNKTTVDKELERETNNLTNAMWGTNDELITAVDSTSQYILRHQSELSKEQASILQVPLVKAMDGMNIDVFKQYMNLPGTQKDKLAGTVTMQMKLRNHMINMYRDKFKSLPESVIDKKVAVDISKNKTLSAYFGTGNRIAQFKTQDEINKFQEALLYKGANRKILTDIALKGNTWSVVAEALKNKINPTLSKMEDAKDQQLRDKNLGELYNNTAMTVNKVGKLFRNSDTNRSNLSVDQQATLDIALYKMFTSQGGMDRDGKWYNPFDGPLYTLMGVDPNKSMTDLSANELLEGLKEFLPRLRDRTAGAQAESRKRNAKGENTGEMLEDKIAAIQAQLKEEANRGAVSVQMGNYSSSTLGKTTPYTDKPAPRSTFNPNHMNQRDSQS